jgi:hypothetical protein
MTALVEDLIDDPRVPGAQPLLQIQSKSRKTSAKIEIFNQSITLIIIKCNIINLSQGMRGCSSLVGYLVYGN